MNRQPASLLDQQTSTIGGLGQDDITGIIDQYQLRVGTRYYLSPATIVSNIGLLGPWGVPYWMQGLATQTCNNNYITAPTPWQAAQITHEVKPLYAAGQFAVGQAPTSGVFTGVEDSCQ